MYQKKELSCKACKAAFFFTEKEQRFYAEKGFEDEPVRCPECRALKKKKRYREREMYKIANKKLCNSLHLAVITLPVLP